MRRSPIVTALVLAVLATGCQDTGGGAAGSIATVSSSAAAPSSPTSVVPPATDVAATATTAGEPAATEPATTEPATTEPATTATEPAATETTAPAAAAAYEVATMEGTVTDPARDRQVPYLVYAPVGLDGAVPLILVSHGGAGNARGHLSAPHLGTTFATGGFVAIHVGHLPSDAPGGQLTDRPADITFLLDQLAAGTIELPAAFTGTIDLTRVGHTGHSFGAYTSHAVGGATYADAAGTSRTFRDERIDAIAPISPQGPDQMGGFDRGPADNTWMSVTIPSYNLIGGAEVNSNAVDSIERPGWRLAPFDRYPGTSDTFRSIIADQDHSDMWRTGSGEVQQFVAGEILEFMRIYVAGDTGADACDIGVGALTTVSLERHPAETGSLIAACS